MALPNTNISVTTVRNELGASTTDVGQLCIHPNINKWAKYKPQAYNKIFGLTDSERAQSHYGLKAREITTGIIDPDTIIYTRPSGYNIIPAISSPYRLGDFRGYNSEIGPEFHLSSTSAYNVDKIWDDYIEIPIIKEDTAEVDILLSDIEIVWDTTAPNPLPIFQAFKIQAFLQNSIGGVVATFDFDQSVDAAEYIRIPLANIPIGMYTIQLRLYYIETEVIPNRKRLFPFPESVRYPNKVSVNISEDVGFTTIVTIIAYVSNGLQYRLRLPPSDNTIYDACGTTATVTTVRIEALKEINFDLRKIKLQHPDNHLFIASNVVHNDPVVSQVSPGVTVSPDSSYIYNIPAGDYITFSIKNDISELVPFGCNLVETNVIDFIYEYNGYELVSYPVNWTQVVK